jgi:sialate O-acetylesterase
MINPIAGLSMKGAIWYQGEANAGGSRRYIDLMQLVAKEWRRAFENRSLPFYQVQLANFMKRQSQPGESSWAALREAQSISASLIPNGGLVTAVDIGDADDIHPRNKRDVGLRLANLALRKTYGLKTTPFSGPELASSKADGSSIRLKFRGSNGALKLTKNDGAGFAIAGEDRKFVWAYAKLVGNEVVVNHPSVMKPVAVRYGWADNPELTLFDSVGLPAFPFRTDNWSVN